MGSGASALLPDGPLDRAAVSAFAGDRFDASAWDEICNLKFEVP